MSGGHFDYQQYRFEDIAEEIEKVIRENDNIGTDESGDCIGRGYRPQTLQRFTEAVHVVRRAAEMVQRIDWLLSCDDGEESFHERWEKEVRKRKTLLYIIRVSWMNTSGK